MQTVETASVRISFNNTTVTATTGLLLPPTVEPIRIDLQEGLKVNFLEAVNLNGSVINFTFFSIP